VVAVAGTVACLAEIRRGAAAASWAASARPARGRPGGTPAARLSPGWALRSSSPNRFSCSIAVVMSGDLVRGRPNDKMAITCAPGTFAAPANGAGLGACVISPGKPCGPATRRPAAELGGPPIRDKAMIMDATPRRLRLTGGLSMDRAGPRWTATRRLRSSGRLDLHHDGAGVPLIDAGTLAELFTEEAPGST
jgi:hypothetical protein